MSVFLEIHCNCLVGKEQCHWTLLRAAWVLFQITVLGKIHRLTAKTRKHNTFTELFSHPSMSVLVCWQKDMTYRTRKRSSGYIKIPSAMIWHDQCLGETQQQGCWSSRVLDDWTSSASCILPSTISNSWAFSQIFRLTHHIHHAVDFGCTPAGALGFRKLFTWAVSSQPRWIASFWNNKYIQRESCLPQGFLYAAPWIVGQWPFNIERQEPPVSGVFKVHIDSCPPVFAWWTTSEKGAFSH